MEEKQERAAHLQGPVRTDCKHSNYLCQLTICKSVQGVVISMTEEQPSANMNALLADTNALLADTNALLEGEQTHTSTSVK